MTVQGGDSPTQLAYKNADRGLLDISARARQADFTLSGISAFPPSSSLKSRLRNRFEPESSIVYTRYNVFSRTYPYDTVSHVLHRINLLHDIFYHAISIIYIITSLYFSLQSPSQMPPLLPLPDLMAREFCVHGPVVRWKGIGSPGLPARAILTQILPHARLSFFVPVQPQAPFQVQGQSGLDSYSFF